MIRFTHLHVHTQYSLLDGVASVERLLERCRDTGMVALAMTDHGNMYGICHFVEAAKKYNIKPIIGCEFYVAKEDRFDRTDSRRYHQILLAKDKQGYENLCTLSSLSFIDGYYYKPRIDKKLLRQYHGGLIATTACMAGFVNQALRHSGEEQAEKELLELYDIFKEDFYLELQRFDNAEQEQCNQFLLKMSKKHGIKVIATNDVHYVNQDESVSHDILLCIQTGADYNDPDRMRFAADTFYLKTPEEMLESFHDHPEAIDNTQEVVDKCWQPELMREIILPQYDVPAGFTSQIDYLRSLTIEGSKKRFKQIMPDVASRIDYELSMIDKMGFAGYFLIVQDYINAARRLGVSVGPGRGSVCGSIVAYCIGITDINPLNYGLFFERFLNPERISMPDIDIDFEDNGRDKVIDYVINKYGKDHVAHLVTFGTMAAKVAIKDVARVLGMSFEQANKLTKLIPFKLPAETLKESIPLIPELKALYDNVGSLEHTILFHACVLEGCKRQTGLHACGIIIAPDKLIHCLPVKTDKETDLLVTQYEGALVDHVGMLKMDFLGLKTLTIIKNTIKMIKSHHGIDIDINNIDLNDKKVLKLFGAGNTVGVFQFESDGMRAWLKKLRPDSIEDLIAMNALFRPGPMQFIDNFIKRKHGQQKIEYPHPLLEPILKNTYGIIVYQEQVMQVAQTIAGYSLAQADILRKAMGKKKPEEMAKQRISFIKGCYETHNISQKESNDIFDMMETFAQYGFNKSHAAAYSVIAFQTAYLKAYYATEFMAASLINAQGTTEAITPLLQDCQRMRIQIKGPSVNESNYDFDVNDNGEICYGLAGIKGVGAASARCIIETRKRHGKFKNIFDFSENIDLRAVNKKTFEALALSGSFDCLHSGNRRQYIISTDDGTSFIEKIISYVGKVKAEEEEMKNSLFGDLEQFNITSTQRPKIPNCIEYPQIDLLNFEKEYIGFYISGHPLERYKSVMNKYCTCRSSLFQQKAEDVDVEGKCVIAGIVSDMRVKMSKRDTQYGVVTLEDFDGEVNFSIFGETFTKHKDLLKLGAAVICVGYITSKYNDPERLEFKCNKVFDMISLENDFYIITNIRRYICMYINKRIIIFACLIVWVYVIIVSVNVGCDCCKKLCGDPLLDSDPSLNSAYSERVISSIREFEYSFFPDQFSGPKKNNYYITTSNEGKYFNIYAWLRVGGMIKSYVKEHYVKKKYTYVYFNLEELKSGEIKFYDDPPNEEFNGPDHEFSCSVEEFNLQKNINKPHEDASKSGEWFRIPKLELEEDFNSSQNTLCHLGNFVGRGRNSLSCLLTLIYLKLVLKEQGLDKRLILVFGDREILTYNDDVCFYDDLLYEKCVGNDIKQNIIHKICMEAIKQQLFVFMGTLTTNSSEKVGLTHKTLTDVGMQNIFRKLNIIKKEGSSDYDYEEEINLELSNGLKNTNSNTDVFFKNILNFNNGNRLKYQINDHDLNPLLTNSAHDANFLTEEHILFAYDGSSGCFKFYNIDPTKGLSRATIFVVNTNRGFISNNVKCIFFYYRFPGHVQSDTKLLSM